MVTVVVLSCTRIRYMAENRIGGHGEIAEDNWFPNDEHLDLGVRRGLQDGVGCRGPLQAQRSCGGGPEYDTHLIVGRVESLVEVFQILRS